MKAPWGTHRVVAQGPGYKIKILTVACGHRFSLQHHRHRDEFWYVIRGSCTARVGDHYTVLGPGGTMKVLRGITHRISNSGNVSAVILEVQTGPLLSESDIVRLEDDYGRSKLAKRVSG